MSSKKALAILILLSLPLLSTNCGYNQMVASDQQVKASWAEVLNQYKRRLDLISNFVNVVQGYASHEKEVLTKVTEARSRVGSINATPELINDPQAFAKYQSAWKDTNSALSKLMVVVENYPNLKADQSFRDLSAELAGTENRLAVSRNRYIKAVQEYNTLVLSFPELITAKIFGFKEKPSFTVEDEQAIQKAPEIKFGK
ncbi:MAG: LemA family protein [Spirochaetia bacterium]|nr:LemA family protein [Spirochaetia bacterium]